MPPPYPFAAKIAKARVRKEKRTEKARALWADKIRFTDGPTDPASGSGTPRKAPNDPEAIARARGKTKGRPLGRKGLVRKLDDIVSQVCREEASKRTGGRCELAHIPHAGCAGIQDAFHIFSRIKYAVRWDKRNIIGTCKAANNLFEHDCDFIHQVVSWFKKTRGEEFYDTLKRDSNRTAKLSNHDLWAKIDEFEKLRQAAAI